MGLCCILFEKEFEDSAWQNELSKTEEAQLFQDDWEDDNNNDDFTEQLRAQISTSNSSS